MTSQQDLMALAQRWQDEAAASWGETKEHATLQRCCDELREAAAQLVLVGEPTRWEIRSRFWSGAPWGPWQSYDSEEGRASSLIPFEGSEWEHELRELYLRPQLPAGVPDGWVLVPKEASDQMLDAMAEYFTGESKWAAAVAAAPQPDNKESR